MRLMNLQETYESLRMKSKGTTIYMTVMTIMSGIALAFFILGIALVCLFVDNTSTENVTDTIGQFVDPQISGQGLLAFILFVVFGAAILVVIGPFVLNLIGTILGFKYAKKESQANYGDLVGSDASGTALYAIPDFRFFKKDAIWKIVLMGLQLVTFISCIVAMIAMQKDSPELFGTYFRTSTPILVYGILNIASICLMISNLVTIGKWRESLKTGAYTLQQ